MIFRAFLNSPLVRRKKKSANNTTNIEDNIPKCQGDMKTERTKKSRCLYNERLLKGDTHIPNSLIDDDSDSDDDTEDSSMGRLPSSAHSSKEIKGVYHNLETFQKKQLKQKVSHFGRKKIKCCLKIFRTILY